MAKVPGRDALDKLLQAMKKEMSGQLLSLQELKAKIGKMHNPMVESRLDKLRARKEELTSIGNNDNGEPINPDIEEGMSWLDNEGVPDLEQEVSDLCGILNEQIENRESKLSELRSLLRNMPPNSFFYNLEDEEEGEDEDPANEAELQAKVREWRRDYDDDTAKLWEIQTRMRTGIAN